MVQVDGRLVISRFNQASNIKIWRRGLPDNVGNNLKVKVGPRLFEDTPYDVLLRSAEPRHVELWHRDPVILKDLHSFFGGSLLHGEINFKNQVGGNRLCVLLDGKLEYDVEVEVSPTRLDYAADYNVLLADTQDILTGFAFEYLRSTLQFGFATGEETHSTIEWILSLRHVVSDLERGLRYIEQHPHHNLIRELIPTRAEKLRRHDATISRMIVQGKGQGPKTRTASGLVLRSKLAERRSRATLDTPEHRWLASQLTSIHRRLVEIHLVERKRKPENKLRQLRTLEELTALENQISALKNLEPIAQAKGFVPPGFTSLTLQTRPGYREAYEACLFLLQTLRVDGGPVGLSVKDTDCLYEYWCYLALVRLIAKITGEQVPVHELFLVERSGLSVQLKRGTSRAMKFSNGDRTLELAYKPRYQGHGLLQKPDVVLTLHDPHRQTLRLVFDTKYRINPEASYVEEFGSPGPPPESIYVLHSYRDAFLEQTGLQGSRWETLKRTVMEGVALFPYADLEDRFRESGLWLQLKESGIGAIPFLPSETRYLEEWLREVLHREGWSTTEGKTPALSQTELHSWQEAERQHVLIAALRQDVNERLDWIKLNRCYYTPFIQDQERQLISRWVAIYSTAATRRPHAITHLAEILSVDLRKSREFDTQWASKIDPDEVQVVYKLGEVRELERPIEDRGPRGLSKRFSRNLWTSRLGIMRATELREVLLETAAEWRLYEQLRMARVEFTLRPGPATLHGENDPDGRSWFVRKHLRVQYRGAAGFLIRRSGLRDEYRSDVEEVIDRLVSQT